MSTPSPIIAAGRIGRRVGIAVFWCMAVFVVVASSRSVILELYGDGYSGPTHPGSVKTCAQELQDLERTLRERAADEVRSAHASARAWITAWDRRYAALDGCGPLDPTRKQLFRLRERTVKLLHAHVRETLPLTEHIERALEHFIARSSTTPET